MAKFFRRYPRKSRKSTARKPSVKKAIRSVQNKIFRKKVLSVIRRNTETKHAYSTTGDAILKFPGNMQTGLGLNIFSPLPNITRGTGEADRIGNQIKPLNLNIKGYLFYKPSAATGNYNSAQSRVAVRMIVCQPKQFSNQTNASSTSWFGNLLQKGNTTTFWTGKLSDVHAIVNKEAITVYSDRTYYMSTTEVAQATAVGYYMIENKNATKFFNINIPVKKTLMYDDNTTSGLQPTNWSPQIICGFSYMDGSAVGSLQECGISYDADFSYEDA